MERWILVSAVLGIFGLIREIRPSEPFVTEFLLEWRNITQETLYQEIYPVGTYSYLLFLVIIFLITDYLKYKPVIISSGLAGIVVYSILLWTESIRWLQISQLFYGLYMATEIAYYTYMFSEVEEDKFDQVAAYIRSVALIGRFISGLSAQLLVSFNILNYRELNYITLSSQIVATIWLFFLPSTVNIYFHQKAKIPLNPKSFNSKNSNKYPKQINGLKLIWEQIKSVYSRRSVMSWSVWYAASTAGFLQVQSYVQFLWMEMEPGQENIYNGIIEAILTGLGAVAAILFGIKVFHFEELYDMFPMIAAAIQAVALILTCYGTQIWQSYLGYICFGFIFYYMITVTSAKIAHQLVNDKCFGLIFGINTFVALVIQTILTIIIVSSIGLELNIVGQFKAYTFYYIILSMIGLMYWLLMNKSKHQPNEIDQKTK